MTLCAGTQYGRRSRDIINHVYKIFLAVWILLGLASCASVLTTIGETYSAILWRLHEKAIELTETIAEQFDDSGDSVVPQPQPPSSRPASRSKNRVAPTSNDIQLKPEKY